MKHWGKALLMTALAVVSMKVYASPVTSLQMQLSLYGNGSDQGPAESRVAGTELEAIFHHTFVPEFQTHVQASANLETGSSQTLYSEEFKPKQGFRLKEAQLIFAPTAYLHFSAGAIDQDRWNQPMLLSRQSFPSLLEKLEWGERLFFRLEALQAYAADTSTVPPSGLAFNEGSSTLFLERVTLGARYLEGGEARLYVSHYLFENASPAVAHQGRFFGNSVTGAVAANSRFVYAFRGYETGLSASAPFGRFHPVLNLSALFNLEAPSARGVGWRGQLALGWEASDSFRLTPALEILSVDSDTGPAIYNSRFSGHSNRQGYGLTVAARFPKIQTDVAAEWFDTSVKVPNALQSDLRWFQLKVRTQHDIL